MSYPSDREGLRERILLSLYVDGYPSAVLDDYLATLMLKVQDPKEWERFGLTPSTIKLYMVAAKKAAYIIGTEMRP